MFPSAPYGQYEAHPDKTLLESRTTPNDGCSATRIEADRMVADHMRRVPEQADEPIDRRRDMTSHEFKWRCHVETEPGHHLSVFVAHEGKLPEIVRHE